MFGFARLFRLTGQAHPGPERSEPEMADEQSNYSDEDEDEDETRSYVDDNEWYREREDFDDETNYTLSEGESILAKEAAPQLDSPLFTKLPAELRVLIYEYALADYPDPSPKKQYRAKTIYTRPTYEAPRRSDTELLTTCRAIYQECWFMPFLHREHTQWLTQPDRSPPEYKGPAKGRNKMERSLRMIRRHVTRMNEGHDNDDDNIVLDSLRIFSQMYVLESNALSKFLLWDMHSTLPVRRLVLTIRHADWWYWEQDARLRFEGNWLRSLCQALPPQLEEFVIELETVERKSGQANSIAEQMCNKWFLKAVPLFGDEDDEDEDDEDEDDQDKDHIQKLGTREPFFADADGATCTPSSWIGASTWQGEHWARDESAPGQITFYVVAVSFLPEHVLLQRGGRISEQARQLADTNNFDQSRLRLVAENSPSKGSKLRDLHDAAGAIRDAEESCEREDADMSE